MTIDFACSSCGRTLRVPEEYQGRKVKCPGCGNIQAAIAAAIQSDAANPPNVPAPQAFSSSSSAAVNPFEAPRTSETSASVGGGAIGNRVPEIGEIFSYAFGVWKEHLLMLIVATLVVFGISFGVGMAQNIVLAIVSSALDSEEAVIGVNFLLTILAQLVQIFVGIGLVRFNLQLLRGGKPDLGLLLAGRIDFSRWWAIASSSRSSV